VVFTNLSQDHLDYHGTMEAYLDAKLMLFDGRNGTTSKPTIAVVNADDAFAAYWIGLNLARRIVSFGLAASASVRGEFVGGRVRMTTPRETFEVKLGVPGEHNVRNALAACAGAYALDVPAITMAAALAEFEGVPGRLERRSGIGGATVIDDSYNANPESMKAAIAVLAAERGRKAFVMGDMGELGELSDAMHAEVGRYAREAGIDALLAIGAASCHAVAAFGPQGAHFADMEALRAAAAREAAAGSTLLVKGSRFMQMERIADFLAADGAGHAV